MDALPGSSISQQEGAAMKPAWSKSMALLMATCLSAGVAAGGETAADNFYQAVQLGAQGNFPAAREALEQALKDDPFYPPALLCLETLKDVAAPNIKPQTATHIFKAMGYGNDSQWQEYLGEINQALKLDPKYGPAYNYRGNAYHELGQYDRAIADYTQALKLNPRLVAAYLNRGVAHRKKGNVDRAIADYSRALKHNPHLPQAYYLRGVAYENKGDHDRAIADFNRSLKINPSFAEAHFNKALACEKAGRQAEAPPAYRSFLQYSSPEYDVQVQYALERLRTLEQSARSAVPAAAR
jgi:tetratricopeptide (TPR) repeat protein